MLACSIKVKCRSGTKFIVFRQGYIKNNYFATRFLKNLHLQSQIIKPIVWTSNKFRN